MCVYISWHFCFSKNFSSDHHFNNSCWFYLTYFFCSLFVLFLFFVIALMAYKYTKMQWMPSFFINFVYAYILFDNQIEFLDFVFRCRRRSKHVCISCQYEKKDREKTKQFLFDCLRKNKTLLFLENNRNSFCFCFCFFHSNSDLQYSICSK